MLYFLNICIFNKLKKNRIIKRFPNRAWKWNEREDDQVLVHICDIEKLRFPYEKMIKIGITQYKLESGTTDKYVGRCAVK